MSFVNVVPEAMATASSNLTGIGRMISEANAAAAVPTTQVLAAANDEVSLAISSLFGNYAQEFQALNAQAALFHDQFAQMLTSGAGAYTAAEAANTSPLQALLQEGQSLAVFSPVKDLTGRPLFGNGVNGAAGTGAAGGAGGGILGDGGR